MSKLLKCPDCGEQKFSWIVHQVQFGNIHEFESRNRDGEGMEMGPITDSDLHSRGPWCTECDEHKDIDDLVIIDE